MKINFLLSIMLSISILPSDAATFIANPRYAFPTSVSLQIKKIASDGLVAICRAALPCDKTLDDLSTFSHIGTEYQFFYNQTPLSNKLTMCEYMVQFSPWEAKGVNLVAIPPSQVDFAMHYFPIEKKYRELMLLEHYTYSAGARVCLQVEGYIHRVEKELGTRVATALQQLIALYSSIRCAPLYAPCFKRALSNPIQTKLLLSSAYQEQVGSLIFDLLTPFISEDKPCPFLATLPEEAIRFLYMYKDHFLHVKLLRWLTYTQQAPLQGKNIGEEEKPYFQLKKSCIDSLLVHGALPVPLLKKVIVESKRIKAWDVLVSLAYHGFLDHSWSSFTMPYTSASANYTQKKDSVLNYFITCHLSTAASDKKVFLLLKKHPAMRAKLSNVSSLRKIRSSHGYPYTDMVQGSVLLGLIYLGARYVASKKLTIGYRAYRIGDIAGRTNAISACYTAYFKGNAPHYMNVYYTIPLSALHQIRPVPASLSSIACFYTACLSYWLGESFFKII